MASDRQGRRARHRRHKARRNAIRGYIEAPCGKRWFDLIDDVVETTTETQREAFLRWSLNALPMPAGGIIVHYGPVHYDSILDLMP